jgi:hypothetical protein
MVILRSSYAFTPASLLVYELQPHYLLNLDLERSTLTTQLATHIPPPKIKSHIHKNY